MINPTGYTALDLVGFTDKGTYASNVNYVKNDIVHYGGNLWRCKIDDTMNVTPAEGENWTVFVGEPTNLVERIIAPLEENPATVAYAAGRQIIYDDWLWEVIDDIAVGDPLIDYAVDPTNANIKKAVPVETQLLAIKAKEGNLANLNTTEKTDLVLAINEVNDKTKYKILLRGTAYSVDDFVLCKSASNSLIFVCTTAGTTADQEPTAYATVTEGNTVTDGTAVFKAVSVSGQITKLSKTEDLISNSDDAYDPTKNYMIGNYVIYNDALYRCTTNCSAGSWEVNQSCFTRYTLAKAADKLKIKMSEITTKPSSSGNFRLGWSLTTYCVISAYITNMGDTMCTPIVYHSNSTGDSWGINCKYTSKPYDPVTTECTVRIYYTDY